MTGKTTAAASLDYVDVFVTFWAAGVLPEMCNTVGRPMIMVRIVGTDGFFLLSNGDGSPLPVDRSTLAGWRLVCYLPEVVDPDGKLDDGVVLIVTEDDDVAALVATAVPLIQLVDNAVR